MSQLDAIVSLQATLAELAEAKGRIEGIPDWMAEVHEEYSARKAEIDAEEALAAESDRIRRESEAELADSQQKLEQYQSQIAQVSNQREYGALLKEIDTVKEKIKEAEEKAITAIEANDVARAKAAELEQAFEDLDSRYKVEMAKWEKEKPGVESTATKLEKRAEKLRKEVPRSLLSLYSRIFERTGGDALAEVITVATRKGEMMWHCSSCHFNVRPQTVVEVRGGSIHHCDSCKRILYWQDDAVEE